MSAISTLEMDRSDWLEARSKGLGGSDAAAAVGASAFKTPLQLFLEKTGQAKVVDISTDSRVKAGNKLEDVVAEWFSEETGHVVRRDNKIRIHREIPYLLANLDRVIQADDRGPGILEIKTTSSWNLKAAREDGLTVPTAWWCQIQHYFMVTGYTWGYFAVLVDGHQFEAIPVQADPEFMQNLFRAERDFWFNHVLPGVTPEPSCEADVLTLYPRSSEKAVEASVELAAQVRQLKEIKSAISALEKEESALTESVKVAMADADTLTADGKTVATWKSTKDVIKFDAKRFEAEQPEMFQRYTASIPGSRRFLVK